MYTTAHALKDQLTMNKNHTPITAHFTIKRKALLYDVENYAYILGNVIPEENQPSKHQLIDVAQDGNIDVVTRLLDLAYSECLNMLFPHVKDPIQHDEDFGNDMLKEEMAFDFTLQMPAEYSTTSVFYLKKLIHEYMVTKVMVMWLSLNNSNLKVEWEIKLEEITTKIRSTLTLRCNNVRRKLHPF